MDKVTIKKGDALAKKLIADYWKQLANGKAWSYFLWPPKYVNTDQWATSETWIRFARSCIKNKKAKIVALEILLALGRTEYLPYARKLVQSWHENTGGHDPEDYYDILVRFPSDDYFRHLYVGYDDPFEIDSLYHLDIGASQPLWSALLSVEDKRLCRHMANCISSVFLASDIDEAEAEDKALPRMAALGPLCPKYLEPETISKAKRFCLLQLEKDRRVSPFRMTMNDNDERSLWIRCDIAYLSWRCGWNDILSALHNEEWYWQSMFDFFCDCENYTLLVWSLAYADDTLMKQALHVMHNYHIEMAKVEGAIAWTRMRNLYQ